MKTTLNIDDTVMDRLRRESARTGRAMSELVETALHGARYLTWGSCYEFLMVVTHPRVLRKPRSGSAAGEFLTAVRQSPGLSMLSPTDRHAAVIAEVMSAVPSITGNLWHDAETAVLMREHGIRRICTRDTGRAIPGLCASHSSTSSIR